MRERRRVSGVLERRQSAQAAYFVSGIARTNSDGFIDKPNSLRLIGLRLD